MGDVGGFFPSLMVQQADPVGSFRGGLQAGYEMQMLPYQMALAQMEYEKGAVGVDLARNKLALQRYGMSFLPPPGDQTGQGSPAMGRTGGIQNGPQDAVAGTASA